MTLASHEESCQVDHRQSASGPPGVLFSNQATLAFDASGDDTNDGSGLGDDPDVDETGNLTSLIGVSVLDVPTFGTWSLILLTLSLGLLWSNRGVSPSSPLR